MLLAVYHISIMNTDNKSINCLIEATQGGDLWEGGTEGELPHPNN